MAVVFGAHSDCLEPEERPWTSDRRLEMLPYALTPLTPNETSQLARHWGREAIWPSLFALSSGHPGLLVAVRSALDAMPNREALTLFAGWREVRPLADQFSEAYGPWITRWVAAGRPDWGPADSWLVGASGLVAAWTSEVEMDRARVEAASDAPVFFKKVYSQHRPDKDPEVPKSFPPVALGRFVVRDGVLYQAVSKEESQAPPEDPEGQHFAGCSAQARRLRTLARKLAPLKVPVLLLGPSGSGKDALSKELLSKKHRPADGLGVTAVNCAALSDAMSARSELFGHKRGSFTGAIADHVGKFQVADRGTIFLDEVSHLPLEVQKALLRVLANHEIEPVGSNGPRKVSVRLICATSESVRELRASGRLLPDLLNRLHGFVLNLSALKERRADVAGIVLMGCENRRKEENRLKEEMRRPLSAHDMKKLVEYHLDDGAHGVMNLVQALEPCGDSDPFLFKIGEIAAERLGQRLDDEQAGPAARARVAEVPPPKPPPKPRGPRVDLSVGKLLAGMVESGRQRCGEGGSPRWIDLAKVLQEWEDTAAEAANRRPGKVKDGNVARKVVQVREKLEKRADPALFPSPPSELTSSDAWQSKFRGDPLPANKAPRMNYWIFKADPAGKGKRKWEKDL